MRREHALAERDFATMIEWITAGKPCPVVTKRYALDDTPQALDDMMNRRDPAIRAAAPTSFAFVHDILEHRRQHHCAGL